MVQTKDKSEVLAEIEELVARVNARDSSQTTGFDGSAKLKIISALKNAAFEIDDSDPALVCLNEATEEAKKISEEKAVASIQADLRAILDNEDKKLFPRDLFQSSDLWKFVLIWILFGLIPLGLVFFGANFFSILTADQAATAGTIGDAFGLANAFFSGLALLFVAATMLMQRKELMLQRNELRQSRDEMRRNSDTQIEQANRMESASQIAALSHIYEHYRNMELAKKGCVIDLAVASGKKRWAIRHLHQLIESDSFFQEERKYEIIEDQKKLLDACLDLKVDKLKADKDLLQQIDSIERVAKYASALMADKFISATIRNSAYKVYDVLWDLENHFPAKMDELKNAQPKELNSTQKKWLSKLASSNIQLIEQLKPAVETMNASRYGHVDISARSEK